MREAILAEHGVTITYKQRGIVIRDIPAVPGKPKHLNEKVGERRTKVIDREYVIEFGLLQWNGEQVKPKPGDNIICGDEVFEVTENESKQCYQPVGQTRQYIRIFTFKTKVVGNPGGRTNKEGV